MLMNALGHLQVTVVDGTALTGLFAVDGSINVIDATSASGYVGLQHPCGAINCVSTDGVTLTGYQAPNGAYYVVNDSTQLGIRNACGAMNVTNFTEPLASEFLTLWGPFGMVIDFTDASIAIDDATDVLDYDSIGQVSSTGALLGPGSLLTYSGPSPKLTEQADGNLGFQAHNLYLNSEAPANQSITVLSGASYAITITGSVSVTASGAATGTWTAGTTTFTAATATLTLGSTSGSGTVHVRRTPSVDTYIATTTAAVYDLPYVYSGGERTGIMVEPAATNLLPTSNIAAFVTTLGNTLTPNAGADPFGGSTATLFTRTATVGYRGLAVAKAASAITYCFQSIVEKGSGDFCSLTIQSNGSNRATTTFNLASGTISRAALVSGGFTAGTSGIESLPGGRFKVWVSATSDTAAVIFSFISFASSNIASVDAADTGATATGLVSHLQLETGTDATSPIITYGAAVARAVDIPSMLGALFPLSSSEGTIFVEVVTPSSITASTDARPASLNDGSTSNRAFMYAGVGGLKFGVRSGGSNSADINAGSIAPSTTYKMAAAYAVNDFAASLNGGAVVTDASGAAPVGLNSLHIGHAGGSAHWIGLIRRLAYFPRRLSDAELQAVTP